MFDATLCSSGFATLGCHIFCYRVIYMFYIFFIVIPQDYLHANYHLYVSAFGYEPRKVTANDLQNNLKLFQTIKPGTFKLFKSGKWTKCISYPSLMIPIYCPFFPSYWKDATQKRISKIFFLHFVLQTQHGLKHLLFPTYTENISYSPFLPRGSHNVCVFHYRI
jgi:hypothetical protein